MAKTDEEFEADLLASSDAVFTVARWLHDGGFDVFIPSVKMRKKHEKSIDYMDDGDLHITKNGVTKKVSVKGWHRTDFTDTSFPFKSVFVANKRFVDIKGDQIGYYMTVNSSGTCICIVNTEKTKNSWSLITYYDKKSRQEETVYSCPIELATFAKM